MNQLALVTKTPLEEPLVNETPLGEPMTPASVEARDKNPEGWLLDYWLNMYMVGIQVYGYDDSKMLGDKILWEQREMGLMEFQQRYSEFLAANRNEYRIKWQQVTLADREQGDGAYQAYVRDLKRMLPTHMTRREKLTPALRDLEDRSYQEAARVLKELEESSRRQENE